MKNKMKLGICGVVLTGGLSVGTLGTADLVAYASTHDVHTKVAEQEENQSNVDFNVSVASLAKSKFKDVRADHYSYEAIIWAEKKGIIDGFNDGSFRPNAPVTEAQFAKMVTEYFQLEGNTNEKLTKTTPNAIWSDSYYDRLAAHGVPMNGYFDNRVRNTTVKRGTVAQTLAYLGGYRMDLKDSINFLLENKVTVGKNQQYEDDLFKYFGSTDDLQRAHVVAFLYRMNNSDLNKISGDATASKNSGISINELANSGKKQIDKSLSKGDNINVPSKPVNPPVVKPPVSEKPNTGDYKFPVSGNAGKVDAGALDFYSIKLSNSAKKAIFETKKFEVSSATDGKLGKYMEVRNINNRALIYSVNSKEDNINFHYTDEDLAILILNGTYGTKFKKGDLKDGKLYKNIRIIEDNSGVAAMVIISK